MKEQGCVKDERMDGIRQAKMGVIIHNVLCICLTSLKRIGVFCLRHRSGTVHVVDTLPVGINVHVFDIVY